MSVLDGCMAGRGAGFGGRWTEPCQEPLDGIIHVIEAPDPRLTISLCDKHFTEVLEAGLVSQPYVGMQEPGSPRVPFQNG